MQNNEMSGSSADMSTERTRESNIILQRVAVRANSATFLPFINTQWCTFATEMNAHTVLLSNSVSSSLKSEGAALRPCNNFGKVTGT